MEMTIYNLQKCRLETIELTTNEANTTWFGNCLKPDDVHMITDTNSGLLIKDNNFNYPVLIYGVTRAEIGNDPKKAKVLKEDAMVE